MLDDIKKIAEKITETVKNDTFGANVRPDYLREAMSDYPLRGGKRLRPALFFWSYELCGGKECAGLEKCAAALEVWHNWTLVHDDIIDEDVMRRNSPTEHISLAKTASEADFDSTLDAEKYGRDMALLCGDLQQGWAVDLLIRGAREAKLVPELILDMVQRMELRANTELISGEALDVELAVKKLENINIKDVMQMIDLKTGALFCCACELGAMASLGYDRGKEFEKISDFALHLGRAFQLQDDILGTFGDLEKLGKDIGSDLRERKPTVLLLKTLECADKESLSTLRGIIGKENISSSDIETARKIMKDSGAYDFVKSEIKYCFDSALNALSFFPENKGRKRLEALIDYLNTREK
ncbi:MAG: polyprenyl synthetase family protein [Lentisphaeria bacterium]|nr:polyprenyl synthetase family protein [Lentisphaeria bacterium]